MITAFVMVKTKIGYVPEVASQISELAEVVDTYSVTGDWDIIAIVKVPEFDDLAKLVPERVSGFKGILQTQTVVALRCFSSSLLEEGWSTGMKSVAASPVPDSEPN